MMDSDIVNCDGCNADLTDTWLVDLQPCNHTICFRCFQKNWARKFSNRCPCSSCRQSVKTSVAVQVNDCGMEIGRHEGVAHKDLDPGLDPIRLWKQETRSTPGEGVVGCAIWTGDNTFTIYNFELNIDEGQIDESSKTKLVKIFAKVFHPILFMDGISDKEDGLPTPQDCIMSEFIDLAFKDRSLALQCLYALSTGRELGDLQRVLQEGNANDKSLVRAVFVAKEMLTYLGSRQRKVSRWQRFFVDTLHSHANEGASMITEMLSKYRVSASTTFKKALDEDACRETISLFNEIGTENSKWHFDVFCKDNFDLKIKGPQPGNDAWVVMTRHGADPAELKRLGFYTSNPTKRISRERRDIEMLTERDQHGDLIPDTEDIFCKATAEEWNNHSFAVLQFMKSVMELHLPSLDNAIQMVEDDNFDWSLYHSIPRNYGLNLQLPQQPTVNDGLRVKRNLEAFQDNGVNIDDEILGANDADLAGQVETLSRQSNFFVDFPARFNLKRNDVVEAYMHTVIQSVNEIRELDSSNEDNNEEYGNEEPLQSLMIPTCGDGAPSAAESKILELARKAGNENDFDRLASFSGGFHWLLEILKKRAMVGIDVIDHYLSQFRKTTNQKKQWLDPHDPRQAEEEMPYYLAAFYRAAADDYAQIHERTAASPAEVHQHMVERAREHPLPMAILQDLMFLQIFVLFQCAEKTSSADLFVAAHRIVLPFLCTSNAPNYIRIAADFIKFWETASEADKIIFENIIMTRRTAKGKPASIDRIQEMLNIVFRFKVGKVSVPGTATKMRNAALGFRQHQDMKIAGESFRNPTWRHYTGITKKEDKRHHSIYARVYIAVRKTNLWGTGPPQIGPLGRERLAESNILESPGLARREGLLDAASLNAYPIGIARLKSYFRLFILSGPHPERPTSEERGGVSIGYLSRSRQQLTAECKGRIKLRTSKKIHEVVKAAKTVGQRAGGPKEQLRRKIIFIQDRWRNMTLLCRNRVQAALEEDSVDSLSDALVYIRKEFSARWPRRLEEFKEEIEADNLLLGQSSEADRQAALTSPLFALTDVERVKFTDEIELQNE